MDPEQDPDDLAFVAHRDVPDRHVLAELDVEDRPLDQTPGVERLGRQVPAALWHRLADEVLGDQRAAVVGSNLAEHHELRALARRWRHRLGEQQEVREGEVSEQGP